MVPVTVVPVTVVKPAVPPVIEVYCPTLPVIVAPLTCVVNTPETKLAVVPVTVVPVTVVKPAVPPVTEVN